MQKVLDEPVERRMIEPCVATADDFDEQFEQAHVACGMRGLSGKRAWSHEAISTDPFGQY